MYMYVCIYIYIYRYRYVYIYIYIYITLCILFVHHAKWQVEVFLGMHAHIIIITTILLLLLLLLLLIPWGAGIPLNITHVFMWCVSQEPATCPHLMQGSLQKYNPNFEYYRLG